MNTVLSMHVMMKCILKRRNLYNTWLNMSPAEKEAFKDSPRYNIIQKEVDNIRQRMRLRSRAIDKYLEDWYDYTPIREQSKYRSSSSLDLYTSLLSTNLSMPELNNPLAQFR